MMLGKLNYSSTQKKAQITIAKNKRFLFKKQTLYTKYDHVNKVIFVLLKLE